MPTIEPAGTPEATITELSPFTFIANQEVIAEDAVEVIEGANYAVCTTTVVHYCGGFGAGSDFLDDAFDQSSADNIFFDAALNTWERRGGPHFIRVGQSVYSLIFIARCLVAVAETVEVRILIDGTVRSTLFFSDAENGAPLSDQILVSDFGGPGYYAVTLEIRRTSSGTTNNLIQWTLDGEARDVATLPAPAG